MVYGSLKWDVMLFCDILLFYTVMMLTAYVKHDQISKTSGRHILKKILPSSISRVTINATEGNV